MPSRPVPVQWQVAEHPSSRKIARSGAEVATPQWNHSVHAEVSGLRPDREYWYRFRVGNDLSLVGRTRTVPALGTALASMRFAFASCQNFYEGGNLGTLGRAHLPAHEAFTLEDYRIRHSQYKLDPSLQAAHAAAPWVVAPDDHEVENDWAGDILQPDSEPDQDPAVFRARRAAAYKAYYENLALRKSSMPVGPEMQVFRRLTFGGLGSSWATWNILANQVLVMQVDHAAGVSEQYSRDPWDG